MTSYREDGKPNNIFLSAKTEKALKEKVIELKMKMKAGELIKQPDTLLNDYANNWLKTYKASVSINTKAIYGNVLNHYIKPELEHILLNKLVPSDIQKLIKQLCLMPILLL